MDLPQKPVFAEHNKLLAALSPKERAQVEQQLQPMELPFKRELYADGDEIDFVYFVTAGVVSLVKDVEEGSTVEIATVGLEGFIGVPILLASDKAPYRVLVQIPGSGFRMPAAAFRQSLETIPRLRDICMRYALALMNQI